MLAKKGKFLSSTPEEVMPIVGTEQKSFLMSEMSEDFKQSFMKAKAPEHTKIYNHECE